MSRNDFNWDKVRLDANCNLPFYIQIAEFLRKEIDTGRLLPGVKLPSSRRLQSHFHLSSNSVVAGIQQLVDEGYLIRHPRIGTFVISNHQHASDASSELSPLVSVITGTPPCQKPLNFHAVLLKTCNRIFSAQGWRLHWSFPREGEGMYYLCRKIIAENHPRAVILAGFSYEKAITSEFIKNGIPLVTIGPPEDKKNVSYVDNDHFHGMEKVVESLLNIGHRNILLLDNNTGNYVACQERRRGYIAACNRRGLIPDARLLIQLSHNTGSPQEFLEEMKLLKKYSIPVSAVIVYGERIMKFVLQYQKKLNSVIPSNIPLLLYNNARLNNSFGAASWDIGMLVEKAAGILLFQNHKTISEIYPIQLNL